MAEDRESRIPEGSLGKLVGAAKVISTLGALVGLGIWVGNLQAVVAQLEEDCSENETKIVANSKAIQEADGLERDRLNTLTVTISKQFNSDKDELWDIKRAMAAINTRVALYHEGGLGRSPAVSLPEAESPRPLSTREKQKLASKAADRAVLEAIDDADPPPAPMPSF